MNAQYPTSRQMQQDLVTAGRPRQMGDDEFSGASMRAGVPPKSVKKKDFRKTELKWAKEIAMAQTPAIIISDAYVNDRAEKGYPDLSSFCETFAGIPLIFESQEGADRFRSIAGTARAYVTAMTMGILVKREGAAADYDSLFNDMDCIVQCGSLAENNQSELKQIKGYDCKVIIHDTSTILKGIEDTETYVVMPYVNFFLVQKETRERYPNGRPASSLMPNHSRLHL